MPFTGAAQDSQHFKLHALHGLGRSLERGADAVHFCIHRHGFQVSFFSANCRADCRAHMFLHIAAILFLTLVLHVHLGQGEEATLKLLRKQDVLEVSCPALLHSTPLWFGAV